MEDENGRVLKVGNGIKRLWINRREDDAQARNEGKLGKVVDITWNELETAVKSKKKSKSAGLDEILIDIIHVLGGIGLQW